MSTSHISAYAIIVLCSAVVIAEAQESTTHITTTLMNSTFKLEGSGRFGTGFLVGMPYDENPEKGTPVLVTAAHVFDDFKDDAMKVHWRIKVNDQYQRYIREHPIRANGTPLWARHPDADVAAILVEVPTDAEVSALSTVFLATDEQLHQFEVRPSDQIFALGYPMGREGNAAGFPILRAGSIASYPLTPTKQEKIFKFDLIVYPGNSGGPVFLRSDNRIYGGTVNPGYVQLLLGLVFTGEVHRERIPQISDNSFLQTNLNIANVIHASFIRETIEILRTQLPENPGVLQQ